MIACYKYIKKRSGKGGPTLGFENNVFKLEDNVGTKSNRYKLVTNRFRLEIGRRLKTIRGVRF